MSGRAALEPGLAPSRYSRPVPVPQRPVEGDAERRRGVCGPLRPSEMVSGSPRRRGAAVPRGAGPWAGKRPEARTAWVKEGVFVVVNIWGEGAVFYSFQCF